MNQIKKSIANLSSILTVAVSVLLIGCRDKEMEAENAALKNEVNSLKVEINRKVEELNKKSAALKKSEDNLLKATAQIRSNREKKEKEQSDIIEAKNRLKSLALVSSRVYSIEKRLGDKLVAEFTVKNETKHPIAAASVNIVLSQVGRSIPLFKNDFSSKFSGGLEPGEQFTFKLTPNQFGMWSYAPDHSEQEELIGGKEIKLSLSSIHIYGADGKIIADSELE